LPVQACDARMLQWFLGARVALSQLNSEFFNIFLLVFATNFQLILLEIGCPNGSPMRLEHWNKHSGNGFRRGVNPMCPADSIGNVCCCFLIPITNVHLLPWCSILASISIFLVNSTPRMVHPPSF
jgi:hypothetical protein